MNADEPIRPIPVLDYAPQTRGAAIIRGLYVFSFYLIAAALGAGLAAAVAGMIVVPRYTAVSRTYLQPSMPQGSLGSLERANSLNTEAVVMTSTPVLLQARSRLVGGTVFSNADWDRGTVDARVEARTDLLRLTVSHTDPARAAEMNNAVLRAYAAQALQSAQYSVQILELPAPAAQLVPRRNPRPIALSALLGAVAGVILLALYRQKRTAR